MEAAELLTLLTTALGVGRLVGWRWMAKIAQRDFGSRCRFASGHSELAKAKCLPAGALYRLGPVLVVIEWESFRPAPAGDWAGFGTSSPGGQVTEYGYFFRPATLTSRKKGGRKHISFRLGEWLPTLSSGCLVRGFRHLARSRTDTAMCRT